MAVRNLLKKLISAKTRIVKIIRRGIIPIIRVHLGLSNHNDWVEYANGTKLAQPAYFNSSNDYSIKHLISQSMWAGDLNTLFKNSEIEQKLYQEFNYDLLIKKYFPTKGTAFQNINMNIAWANSFWNPENTKLEDVAEKFKRYRRSDILFGDYIINTQGIYKTKKVMRKNEDGSQNQDYAKVKSLFQKHLNEHKGQILPECHSDVLETLIDQENLFLVQLPELMELEKSRPEQERFKNILTTNSGNQYETYLQIPYGIFANVKNHAKLQVYRPDQLDFICLGTVFNQRTEVYHPFDKEDLMSRDAWEMAKFHFANAFNQDNLLRVHLGYMHYATGIYTTALSNLAKSDQQLSWLRTDFLDPFTKGLLQINTMASLNLIDADEPGLEKVMYMRGHQSVKFMSDNNAKLNMLEFCPEVLAKNSYESDCIKIERHYYNHLQNFVDRLFENNQNSWKGQTQKMGKFIYDQLVKDGIRMDSLPESFCKDSSPNSLKKLLTNLLFIWVVQHGETFSMVSMNNLTYMVPTFVSKPLSELPSSPMTDLDKQQWFPPFEVFKGGMGIIKIITYRNDKTSLLSSWSSLGSEKYQQLKHFLMNNLLRKQSQSNEQGYEFYGQIIAGHSVCSDYWNDMAIKINARQQRRLNEGLFYNHWMMPNELQNSICV